MHRRQNPHSSWTGSSSQSSHPVREYNNNNNNTSPPSTKLTINSTTTAAATHTAQRHPQSTAPSNAKKGSSVRLHHRKSASAQLPHHHNNNNNITHNHNHNHSHNHHRRKSSHHSISKLLGPGSGPASWSVKPDDDKSEMATSFLQYCAMCEKQITVPCNSVLYCSESCRRKDSCKPLSASSYTYTTAMSSTTPPDSPPMSPRAIVAPLTPTRSSPKAIPGLSRIPSDLHDAKSDLDPTEWKPVICTRTGSSTSLASSDAWNYLSQFHRDESSMLSMMLPFTHRRSAAHRSSASLSTLGMPPSLTNTPSTVASSANSSSSSDYISAYYNTHDLTTTAAAAATASAVTRPLPPRHNPSFSTSAGATKGVELVVPHIVAPAPVTGCADVSVSLSSSPTDSHDGGIWLKPHRREVVKSTTTTTPSSIASAILVDKTH